MKVAILSAIYSDNLGDGVLALATEKLVSLNNSEIEIVHLDISGREDWPRNDIKSNSKLKKIFHALPGYFKDIATLFGWFFIFKPKVKGELKELIAYKPDRIIVAGGQLISDIHLNFPLKLSYIIKWANKNNIDVSYLAVGVAEKYSFIGRYFFNRALSSPCVNFLGVRDKDSLKNLSCSFGVVGNLIPDAGLWASEIYRARSSKNSFKVGLGISSPDELGLHSELKMDEASHTKFWLELVRKLIDIGFKPVLFTNGSSDDEQYKERFVLLLEKLHLSKNVDIAEKPSRPNELLELISSLGGLISHRLHANIIAHSYGVPSIGLKWDTKLESYFQLIGREKQCVNNFDVDLAIKELLIAIESGVPLQTIANLKSKTSDAVNIITRKKI
jgi:polysaccharide pyruvyl transferase WcaK-like protein